MISALSRKFLLYLAHNEAMRQVITAYGMAPQSGFARRFIAGETLEEALQVVLGLNRGGFLVTLDALGENVTREVEARQAAERYLSVLDKIHQTQANSNISLKLTQLGLDIGWELCEEQLRALLEKARVYDNFVRIDMESSAYTQRTLDMYRAFREKGYTNVGVVIQAYLYRSEKDVKDLIAFKARVRLCKGAYSEPKTVAFQSKREVDQNYLRLMKWLLEEGNYPAIATHDEAILQAAREFTKAKGIPSTKFEFQMLYGVRRDLQERLVREGYNLRIYVPFGKEWYPYFMRRLAERPANVQFLLKNIAREFLPAPSKGRA